MITIGGCSALIVPISGMVIWKSASTSRRYASNGSSVRSSSSISSTGGPAPSCGCSACSSGRWIRKRSVKMSCARASRSVRALRLGHADLEHLARIVPLVHRRADVQALVALQADQATVQGLCQNLADLGLADPGLALEEQRPAELEREVERGRERPVGDVVAARQKLLGVVDGGDLGTGHRAFAACALPLDGVAPPRALPRCCGLGGERPERPLDRRKVGRGALGSRRQRLAPSPRCAAASCRSSRR